MGRLSPTAPAGAARPRATLPRAAPTRPETYGKGDLWVFLAIVAQMQGLDG